MSVGFRRAVVSFSAWVVGAAASIGVGLLALSLIDDGLTIRTAQPSTPDVVAEASPAPSAFPEASAGIGTASASATGATVGNTAGTERVLSSPGGTVLARCNSAGAYLVSWSPAQGYRVDDVRRGPAAEARVVFQVGEQSVELRVTCVSGVPQGRVVRDYEDDSRPHPSGS